MEHLVYYDIAAAFVLLTALVAYHLRKYSDNFQSRVYRVMLYAPVSYTHLTLPTT